MTEEGIREHRSIFAKAWSFVRAMLGGWDAETRRVRFKICDSCTHVQIERKQGDDGDTYETRHCGMCGCPAWSLSQIDNLIGYRGWKCPVGKFGYADAMTPKAATVHLTRLQMRERGMSDEEIDGIMDEQEQAKRAQAQRQAELTRRQAAAAHARTVEQGQARPDVTRSMVEVEGTAIVAGNKSQEAVRRVRPEPAAEPSTDTSGPVLKD